MEKINEIQTELKALGSGLAAFEPAVPYQVPAGYFDAFPQLMLSLCKTSSVTDDVIVSRDEELEQLSPLLSKAPKAMPFSVPAGYFSQLPADSASQDDLPAILNGVDKTRPYGIPQGYFEQLPAAVLNRVQTPGAKVITGSFRRNIFRYAAAAVITGIAVTAGFFIFEKGTNTQQLVSDTKLKEKAAQASDEEILNYLQNIPLPAVTDPAVVTGKVEIQDDAILELLADVTDEDLQQYLQAQTGVKTLIN